jgi:hypothetical protein
VIRENLPPSWRTHAASQEQGTPLSRCRARRTTPALCGLLVLEQELRCRLRKAHVAERRLNGSLCACSEPRAYFALLAARTDMGRIQGEHHVRSHRLHGTRRRHPAHRGSARGGWSVDRHLEVLEPQYGLRCPTILAAAALRRTSGLALRTSSAPTLQSAIRLLARLPSPSGLVSATKTCPRPAELCRDEGLYRPPSWASVSPARKAAPNGGCRCRQ